MFSWLKQLMKGDQSAAPQRGMVKRDELGRITEAQFDLSPPAAPSDQTHPSLALSSEMQPKLDAACQWLVEQNIRLANAFAIGQEKDRTFSQETGLLTLRFDGQRDRTIRCQILGSFDPRDKSFMWAWANPSLRADLVADSVSARSLGESLENPALTTGIQTGPLDDIVKVVAFVAKEVGAGGVYRIITNSWTTVFLSMHLEAFSDSPSNDVELARDPTEASIQDAYRLIDSYEQEMFDVDRMHQAGGKDHDSMNSLLQRKIDIYQRYWSRDDEYFEPCSFSWPSDHDPDRRRARFSAPCTAGGTLIVTIRSGYGQSAYRIDAISGAQKILDNSADFRASFFWPS